MPSKSMFLLALALVAAAHAMASASAQEWPARPLTLVVPWAAGGGTDVMGRIMAKRMSGIMGQQGIVENIARAGGVAGSSPLAKAAPEGDTFVLGRPSDAANITVY